MKTTAHSLQDGSSELDTLLRRIVPPIPRGWSVALFIEDPLTQSFELVAARGAIADRSALLSYSGLEKSEPWLLQRLGIAEIRIVQLPAGRPFGRLMLLARPDAAQLSESLLEEIAGRGVDAAVDLERLRAHRENEKFSQRLRRVTELELSTAFTESLVGLFDGIALAAVFAVVEEMLSVLIVRRRDGEGLFEFNRRMIPLEGSHLAAVMRGEPSVCDATSMTQFGELVLFERLAEEIRPAVIETIPLEPSGRLAGSLFLFRSRSTTERSEESVLRHMVDSFALSIDRIRPERRQASTLLYLQELFRTSGRALSTVLQTVTEELIHFLGADAAVIALLDSDTGRLLLSHAAGYGASATLPKFIPLEEEGAPSSILAHVVRAGKPYVAADTRTAAIYLPADRSICSEIGAPLRIRGETFGVALASSRTRGYFGEDDIGGFQIFTDQVALAVENARLMDALRAREERHVARRQRREFGFDRAGHAENLQYHFGNLIGDPDGPMGEVYRTIERVAAREDDTVLIVGETGTGKEMIAHAIHHASPRRPRPMVATNFAALGGDPNLIQSELFGHEKGSFTGAMARRKGCFESAHRSTLFIDEVGDIVPSVQVKLLRVLGRSSSREFTRLGGEESMRTNVRVLAATNKDLLAEIRGGHFREDLYYRLAALVVRIPPLRTRAADIPLFVRHFVARMSKDEAIRIGRGVDPLLTSYHWPGNIRQLESVVLRAVVLYGRMDALAADDVRRALEAEEGYAGDHHVPGSLECPSPPPPQWFWDAVWTPWKARRLAVSQIEELMRRTLAECNGFYSRAALRLGVARNDYQRFVDFLSHAGVNVDYRAFRRRED